MPIVDGPHKIQRFVRNEKVGPRLGDFSGPPKPLENPWGKQKTMENPGKKHRKMKVSASKNPL
jgi:hypothetical protein